MTRIDTLRNDLARLQKTEGDLRKDIAKLESAAVSARAAGTKKRGDATKTKSTATARSHLRSAEAEDKKLAAAEKKLGDLKVKAARNARDQADKSRSLDAALKQQRTADDRSISKKRREDIEHAKRVARISRPEVRYISTPEPKPEKLRVLYLTSNPEATEYSLEQPDGSIITQNTWLRTEAEVRQVKQALRGSKFRDQVILEHKPAANFQDLLDGINDFRPHVIHFSGHGGDQSLLLDNGSVEIPEGVDLPFELLLETIASTDTPPTLLVLNACSTLDGAEVLLPSVPVIIAMSDTIADTAAAVFATQFYAAIASAQSVGSSLKQAKVAMKAALLLEEAELPQHVAREGTDISQLRLVANDLF